MITDNIREYEKPSINGRITIGRRIGYSRKMYGRKHLVENLFAAQTALSKSKGITLSARLTKGSILLAGQDEPCFILDFINYPRFPVTPEQMKAGVLFIARTLLQYCQQNRIVVELDDKTRMLDLTDEIDPGITVC